MEKNFETSSGLLLRQARENKELSVEELSRELQIPAEYIRALEEENYEVFPARIYARGFFEKIVESLFPESSADLKNSFNNSWPDNHSYNFQNRLEKNPLKVSSYLSLITGGPIFLFLAIFFGWRIYQFVLPPQLDLKEPKDNMLLEESKVRISGNTQKESHLTVNGLEINVDGQGHFESNLQLVSGLNTLEFYVQSRFGKSTKLTRHIVVNNLN